VCVVSLKECWQDEAGVWYSSGGFPLQMGAIASLFDAMSLLITRRAQPGAGGMRLPPQAQVVVLNEPRGRGIARKLSVVRQLRYYWATIARYARDADVVHVPPPGDIPVLGMLVALGLRKRLLVRYCASWVKTSETTVMNRVTRGLMRRFAGGRNVMLATGEADLPPASGIHWIFATGVSAEELRGIEPAAHRALHEPARLAYVGRLSPEKGLANLIRAIDRLDREGLRPLPHLRIIGDGPQRPELERLVAELGRGDVIRFEGQLDRKRLSAALSEADLCVQPSLTEGYCKAWLDAFAHGLPVLSSEAGAARAVIGVEGERGWLVPPGDVPALTAALRRILTEPQDWASLRGRCRAFAEDRTLDVWADRIGRICAGQWNVPFDGGRLQIGTGVRVAAAAERECSPS